MSRKEQLAGQTKQSFYYLRCKGKYEDTGSGEKHCICGGHVFTRETQMGNCPICDTVLVMVETEKELSEAITCVSGKCVTCKNRYMSAALNDTHCVGGERYKDGILQKVAGSPSCNGCLCAGCCKEIIDDANAVKLYGLSAVIKAQAQIREAARQVVLAGNIKALSQTAVDAIMNTNTVLQKIKSETRDRWINAAFAAVENERKGCKPKHGSLANTLTHVADTIRIKGAA
jgi:hypothetical protein